MRKRISSSLLLVAALVLFAAAPATASTRFGEVAGVGTPGGPCLGCSQVQVADNPAVTTYVVPHDGVIVQFDIREGNLFAGTQTASLQVWRPQGGGAFRLVGESTAKTLFGILFPGTVDASSYHDVRVSAVAGDHLGLRVYFDGGGNTSSGFASGDAADLYGQVIGAPVIGDDVVPTNTPGYRLNLAAAIERDADGDGFGDETQDECPVQSDVQGICRPDVSGIRFSRTKFRVNDRGAVISATRKGTKLSLSLAGAATTRFRVQRVLRGRVSGSRCVKVTPGNRSNPSCNRYKTVHSFTRALPAGSNSIAYSGRYRKSGRTRLLTPGKYRFAISAQNVESTVTAESSTVRVVRR